MNPSHWTVPVPGDCPSPEVNPTPRNVHGSGTPGSRLPWRALLATCLILSLYPVWANRFPPLQDYPQHLAMAHALVSRADFQYCTNPNLEIRYPVGPYAIFYLVVTALSLAVSTEIAGKLFITGYFLLVALLCSVVQPRDRRQDPAWGALLLFPFALNQIYLLGMVNFFLAIPLVILAVLDLEKSVMGKAGRHPIARGVAWQFLLLFTHPYALCVYFLLALLVLLLARGWTRGRLRSFAPAGLGAALLGSWILFQINTLGPSPDQSMGGWYWSPMPMILGYYLSIFTGYEWFARLDATTLACWVVILGALLGAITTAKRGMRIEEARHLALFACVTLLVFALPFGKAGYNFLGPRFAPIAYFFLALFCSRVHLRGVWKTTFLVAVVCLLLRVTVKLDLVAEEVDEAEAVLTAIPACSSFLPLVFDNDSPELDHVLFDIHLHEFAYHTILVGPGLHPYWFNQRYHPIRYRPPLPPAAPGLYDSQDFSWAAHSEPYDYFLTRGVSLGFLEEIRGRAVLIRRSGRWALYEKLR